MAQAESQRSNATIIRIGHSAYSGANASQFAVSRAGAVRILQQRGVKRDDARRAVKAVMEKDHGYQTVRAGWDPVEVYNCGAVARENSWSVATARPSEVARWPHRA